ncbi:hypothetical protein BC834DRAFT_852459 [Gloeopeniophorella convolvens]|nr:hypothetical protein BC834DRAFT_852459 [Gloeopeniophorella convolvens]
MPQEAYQSIDNVDSEPAFRTGKSSPLCTISSLPTEILCMIFCDVRLLHDYTNYYPNILSEQDDLVAWTVVTRVCAHWRRVAEQCYKLWELIPLSNAAWTQRALALSYPHPIVIRAKPCDSPSFEALCFALREPSRIRVLLLHETRLHSMTSPGIARTVMGTAFDEKRLRLADATALETLHLEGGQYVIRRTGAFDVRPLPRLTSLSLTRCAPWATEAHMLDTLAALPALERLYINTDVFAPDVGTRDPPPRVVRLPCLRYLDIVGPSSELAALLRVLQFPEAAELHMDWTVELKPHDGLAALAGALAQHYASPVRFRRLTIAENEARASCWVLHGGGTAGLLYLDAREARWRWNAVEFITALLALLLPADSLCELDIAACARYGGDDLWMCIAPLVRGVERVCAVGTGVTELVGALQHTADDPRRSLLSNMCALRISRTVFLRTQTHQPDVQEVGPFLDMVRRWRVAGMSLQIVLDQCQVEVEFVESLRQELGAEAVAWDGIGDHPGPGRVLRTLWTNFQ